MRIQLARPDVSVPLYVLVLFTLSVLGALFSGVWYLGGFGSACDVMPLLSASCALFAAFPWNLRNTRLFRNGRLTAGLTLGLAVLLAAYAIECRP